MTKPVDLHAAAELINDMIGYTYVAVADSTEYTRSVSPIVRAHFLAVLGMDCPRYAFVDGNGVLNLGHKKPIKPFADYLRGVSDLIDPPTAKCNQEA